MNINIFILDELENALDSLRLCSEYIVNNNRFKWKWIAISLHHSLYSFCIACLTQGNFDNVIATANDDKNHFVIKGNEKYCKKSKKIYIGNGPAYRIQWIPSNLTIDDILLIPSKKKKNIHKLIGFWTALARVQDSEHSMGGFQTDVFPLILSDDDIKKIVYLAKIRNELAHFIPKTFGISINDIKESAKVYLNSIEF